ncbi:bifunctional proline dehydrogenase/L-glutamate gamma-semialdehyde dehydrogenase PutA [Methylomicrobium sp. Wu6]|uniref:bifunctional proline dehydrogenase/L-glutamate gamma-semialdehyde dehydrogenase PutA n=1 Tax=Methylomicrobium sp. Wu6 TaxID=3107928 RepID=UPI002DD688CA|nr:bifunctional proline dehydrogenase/L-glutamate gamma-semialdehyde dehydrogenase PutA [Methylomicrobium sp. Wu6]MEC4748413.1 bifunctional proline dehydrogenase/L-glutamate gamma-semialdehyde dehydrogenase PutA [Methylomicrobium sp. Wu6]
MKSDQLHAARIEIEDAYLGDEAPISEALARNLQTYDALAAANLSRSLVSSVRAESGRQSLIDTLLHEYQLNTQEGIVLMEMAEALLRIPDSATQDAFLQDKLGSVDWGRHQALHDTLLVKLLTGALSVTGRIENPENVGGAWLTKLSAPLIRSAVKRSMQLLASHFVFAETIEDAIKTIRLQSGVRYSFDMLGEAALTAADAERYFQTYQQAIEHLAQLAAHDDLFTNPGISIKLSALCPRYEPLQKKRAVNELSIKLLALATQARRANIGLTVDAEESERLDMSLDIFSQVLGHPGLAGWPGFGLAVQAYQKRALPIIRWLAALAESHQRRIPVRLVKGAYWDGDIKRAQESGLAGYPVFTRKTATDVSYLACAETLLAHPEAFYPQFATHNAHTVAAILTLAKAHTGFEFQRLHGMGGPLYERLTQTHALPCRIYAPIGNFDDLLPYLVRRLLENGANTSFLNRVENPSFSVDEIVADPVARLQEPHIQFVQPSGLFGQERLNSAGINLSDSKVITEFQADLDALAGRYWEAFPLIDGKPYHSQKHPTFNPCDLRRQIGHVMYADSEAIGKAADSALKAFNGWRLRPVQERVACLKKAADLLELYRIELVSLCVREGGRTIKDALAEVREAVDFCRYYAAEADKLFAKPIRLPGPTGEENYLARTGRGAMVCISPWNFPIAIFVGQIAAALAAGNTVIAKPATQTSLTAMRCVQLLHQAGIPGEVLQFLPANGGLTGKHLLTFPGIGGVIFTGSTATARLINQTLAQQQAAIVPLIAETGGQNAMIADSSAHVEQLVMDAMVSAFNSAGQRCSALRVLYVQEEIADKVIQLLIGAMQELTVGDPGHLATDIGPIINVHAAGELADHIERMRRQSKILYQVSLHDDLAQGNFFPPSLIEISGIQQLEREVFGPVLHVVRYRADKLAQVIESINASGYGLTLGIHSRINSHIQAIIERARAGNIYVNRNMIGAVVGVQPFGGMGLSGTGPKAGGPDYLRRLVSEQTVTINSAAVGGNAALLSKTLL